ncbi:hypothetical protein [Nonomuraea dietziae]|uniref:Capsular polysaccharide biosynthesis protein n=1 Tax=Nonomuraea dietziae TaxID=65515 RepID=A0A7W5VCJ1_9ACTN|nr:hypothetical protein [Nonomuraea dietziae]MBB3729079.1 capsular polysaccharide biosynthesis protein [Nonomuraea dietziae]
MVTERSNEDREVGLLEALWRYKWSSLLLIVLAGLAGGLATVYVFTSVEATAKFAVTDPRSTTFLRQGVSSDSSYIAYTSQRAAFTESAGVLDKARQLLAAEQAMQIGLEDLRKAVEAKPGTNGGIVEVTVTAKTDRSAAQIANAVVAAYQMLTEADAQREQQKLLKSVRSTRARIEAELKRAPARSTTAVTLGEALVQLQLKEGDAAIDLAQYGSGVRFVDQANPLRVTPSQAPKNAGIGLAVGLLLAIVIAFLRATNPIATAQRVTTGTGQRQRTSKTPPTATPPPAPAPSLDEEQEDDVTAVYDRDKLLGYVARSKPGENGVSVDAGTGSSSSQH